MATVNNTSDRDDAEPKTKNNIIKFIYHTEFIPEDLYPSHFNLEQQERRYQFGMTLPKVFLQDIKLTFN